MKKLSSFAFIAFFTGIALFGQRDETLFGEAGLRLTGAWGGTHIGITGFDGENAVTRGGFGVLEFNKTLLAGFGGVQTSESMEFDNGQLKNFDLEFGGLMLGLVPKSHRPIHSKFSFLMGGGKVKVDGEGDDKIFVVQPSAGAEINVFRWFKMSLEGGYRFVSDSSYDPPANEDLSGFFGELKLRFGWSWGN
jgi:hypothetical protein